MPPLPILKTPPASEDDLVRFFAQAELEWCRPLGEETTSELGYRICNPSYPHSDRGNCLLGFTPSDTSEIAAIVAGSRMVEINASLERRRKAEVENRLADLGWVARRYDVLKLGRARTGPTVPISILPARAALGRYESFCAQWSTDPAEMLHLDDPRYEPSLALIDRNPVGTVGLQSNGIVGVIRDLYVTPAFRGRGIGRSLLSHTFEASGRSEHRHVLAAVEAGQAAIFTDHGFSPVGQWTAFVRPPP